MKSAPPDRISRSDILAGVSVALILIPQSMAYAELAGLPPHHGLYAATIPLIAAAFLASSPYLQTGPVALTGLLTFGALVPLAPVGTAEYAALAALLALVVGVVRIIVGLLKAGWLVYLMSHSMMTGFLSAAAILILLVSATRGARGGAPRRSRCSSARVVRGIESGYLGGSGRWPSLVHGRSRRDLGEDPSADTGGPFRGSGRSHFLSCDWLLGCDRRHDSKRVPTDHCRPSWHRLPSLILPGIVISVIGFAEGVSISRVFASEERQHWDADREFLSKGMANIAAALTGGLPVGGSLSRTSVNRLAGAKSRWSGMVTGVTVLAFLPLAPILAALPRAILSGIVIAAIWALVRPKKLLGLWNVSPVQAVVGWATFLATLVMSPHIDRAILFGITLSAAVHLWRELKPHLTSERVGDTLVVEPSGVLWFGSAPALEDLIFAKLADERDVRVVVMRCGGLGRIDLSGAYALLEMLEQAGRAGIEMTLEDVPQHARRLFESVGIPVADQKINEKDLEFGTRASLTP